ncbi:MAG: hypothetical protein N2171_06780 [Clostridia bacterium]|nr:hypothetical protein [Clostridia bacterium]
MKKNVIIVSGVYIATIIGAGFASGQEVVQFFVKYGNRSIVGIILASVGFSLAAGAVLNRARMNEIDDFKEYLAVLMGDMPAKFIDFVITIFMMGIFCVMAAGSGATLHQLIGISPMVGAALMSVFCYVCFLFNVKGVMAVNGFLAPVIVFGIFFVCFYILRYREIHVFSSSIKMLADNWIVSGANYVSYNLLTASVILVSLRRCIKTKREAVCVGIISGAFLGLMLFLIWTVIKIYYGKIILGEVPMLTLAVRQGYWFGIMYMIVLFIAMVTTAISSGYGVIERISMQTKLDRNFITICVCIIGFAGAGVGFSSLIEYVYRICGYAGFILLAEILWDIVRMR